MDYRIVIIEDEEEIVFLIRFSLTEKGFNIKSAPDGISGLRLVKEETPDLVILNQILPDLDGLEVCRELKRDPKTNHIPIIIITPNKKEEHNGIIALELGADDFIVKPFSSREVLAKVKALLRRSCLIRVAGTRLFYKGILVDTLACIVKDREREVELTHKEFGLLVALLRNKGQVMSRQAILNNVWGPSGTITPRTVDNHIRNLRRKIPVLGGAIVTVNKFGYKLKEED